jgi:KDO2-lipid IV(A) lauroyltransferase
MATPGSAWYDHKYHSEKNLKIIFAIIPRCPKFLHPPIAAVTALIFFFLLKKERRAIERNIRQICGEGAWLPWKAFQVFYSFCDFMVSYCYVPSATHAQLKSMVSGIEDAAHRMQDCLNEERGLIIWTAHMGNWEFASRLLETEGRKVYVGRVVESGNPAEMALRKMMETEAVQSIDLDDPFASIHLLRVLRGDNIVALQGDRVYNDSGTGVPFFGKEAKFPIGPFVLAYVSGSPILPAVVVRRKWLTYRVLVGKPIRLDNTVPRESEVERGLLSAVRFLEAVLEKYPNQWLNFYDFWSPYVFRDRVQETNSSSAIRNDEKGSNQAHADPQ